MALFRRFFCSALVFVIAVIFASGCFKSDIDTVKDGFFLQDKTQKIGKFLDTFKNVTKGKWHQTTDDRGRSIVVFSGIYSNNDLAKIFISGQYPNLGENYAESFASFLDKNQFSLSFSVNFLMAADKNSESPFVISALGLSSNDKISTDANNIDSGIKAVVGNLSFDSLLNKEDVAALNYYFQKFIAEDILLNHNKTARAIALEYEFDLVNLPGMLYSSIKDGNDPVIDYYPIERVVCNKVTSNTAEQSLTLDFTAELTSAYFEALYGKDLGRKSESLVLDCNKFDALNAVYEVLAAKSLVFVKTSSTPKKEFTLLSQCIDKDGFNIDNGQNKLQLILEADGAKFFLTTAYAENEDIKAFKKQQELLYRVDNEVRLSLLQNAFLSAITGKKLSDKELHDEMVKRREQKYKEKGWALPPSLFSTAPADVI